jgi:NDP-sugar pyrophosphorylase family protein
VEASVLGDDVRIGAYAYVVGSVVGDGCVIEQRAHVEQSCLGPRTFVSKNSSVSACVAFGDTDVCVNGIQTCAVAERCGLTSWARPLDLVPGGEVRVRDGERHRSVGELPCGVAFGEGVFVGAGVDIAPGRAIPPGVRLVGDPSSTLQRIPDDTEPGAAFIEDGTLTPVRGRR